MDVEKNLQQGVAQASKLIDTLIEFAVTYGFQILGALVFLAIGLKVAGWAGRRVEAMCVNREIDVTLARFFANICRIIVIVFVIIITLGNFGISIAPLIALAGASAFGITVALQGPLSNFGAGLAIILTRPFSVGDTVTVKDKSGVVDVIALGQTVLVGEDGERISIPNKEVVGQVLVNSKAKRVVETKIAVAADADVDAAIAAIRGALDAHDGIDEEPVPQVGVHDFTYGGLVLGARFWVPTESYFQTRYAVNGAILNALRDAGTPMLAQLPAAVAAKPLTADEEPGGEGVI